MTDLSKILEFIWEKGWIAVIVILLLLIVHDPDRAEKLKELIFLPVFRFFKRGSRQYMAARVGYMATEFVRRRISNELPSVPNVKIKIKWVRSSSDPVLSKDGTLVLRLRETNDQTRNILAATQVALPHLICPTLRPHMQLYASMAIDLTLLRKLTDGLGKHAQPIFHRYFLSPAVDENVELKALLVQLIELDSNGTFVSVFLEELNVLGETLYGRGETSDKTSEIMAFLEYLLTEARRDVSEEITLHYFSKEFKVGIILLAKTWKTLTLGVSPYIKRMDQNIKLGCDSIYIIAYPPAFEFFARLITAAEADDRVSLIKVNKVQNQAKEKQLNPNKKIALFRRNPMFSDSSFGDKIKAVGINEGMRIEGTVLDVSQNMALVDVLGMNGVVHKEDCSWFTVFDCAEILTVGERGEFTVKSIDVSRGMLGLTNRSPELDPWRLAKVPAVGDIVEVTLVSCNALSYYCRNTDQIEVILPRQELSWLEAPVPDSADLLGSRQRVVIFERSDEFHLLKGSVRQLEEDPWPKIHARFPKGTELRATVRECTPNFVKVDLLGGLNGFIPKEAMQKAGYEYADFESTLAKGQKLDVVVTKVFLKKRKIRLDLERNVKPSESELKR